MVSGCLMTSSSVGFSITGGSPPSRGHGRAYARLRTERTSYPASFLDRKNASRRLEFLGLAVHKKDQPPQSDGRSTGTPSR